MMTRPSKRSRTCKVSLCWVLLDLLLAVGGLLLVVASTVGTAPPVVSDPRHGDSPDARRHQPLLSLARLSAMHPSVPMCTVLLGSSPSPSLAQSPFPRLPIRNDRHHGAMMMGRLPMPAIAFWSHVDSAYPFKERETEKGGGGDDEGSHIIVDKHDGSAWLSRRWKDDDDKPPSPFDVNVTGCEERASGSLLASESHSTLRLWKRLVIANTLRDRRVFFVPPILSSVEGFPESSSSEAEGYSSLMNAGDAFLPLDESSLSLWRETCDIAVNASSRQRHLSTDTVSVSGNDTAHSSLPTRLCFVFLPASSPWEHEHVINFVTPFLHVDRSSHDHRSGRDGATRTRRQTPSATMTFHLVYDQLAARRSVVSPVAMKRDGRGGRLSTHHSNHSSFDDPVVVGSELTEVELIDSIAAQHIVEHQLAPTLRSIAAQLRLWYTKPQLEAMLGAARGVVAVSEVLWRRRSASSSSSSDGSDGKSPRHAHHAMHMHATGNDARATVNDAFIKALLRLMASARTREKGEGSPEGGAADFPPIPIQTVVGLSDERSEATAVADFLGSGEWGSGPSVAYLRQYRFPPSAGTESKEAVPQHQRAAVTRQQIMLGFRHIPTHRCHNDDDGGGDGRRRHRPQRHEGLSRQRSLSVRTSDRPLVWAFLGTVHSERPDRVAMRRVLTGLDYHDGEGVGSTVSVSPSSLWRGTRFEGRSNASAAQLPYHCCGGGSSPASPASASSVEHVYRRAVFVPVGRGQYSLDCFRIYEAAVSGAIPVIVARGGSAEFEQTFGGLSAAKAVGVGQQEILHNSSAAVGALPPFVFASSWEEAAEHMRQLLLAENASALAEQQRAVVEWFFANFEAMQRQVYGD